MTALHPIEAKTQAIGVLALRYPLNEMCAHPECDKPTESAHHVFARSKIGNSSWFVALEGSKLFEAGGRLQGTKDAIPHVVGLCGSGTTGHHGDAEEHRAWIKLDSEGMFVWYDHRFADIADRDEKFEPRDWEYVGPLAPQPGSRIKHTRPKKRDHRIDGKPRARARYTIAVPKDEQENGADLLDEYLNLCRVRAGKEDLPAYFVVVPALKALAEDPDWQGLYG